MKKSIPFVAMLLIILGFAVVQYNAPLALFSFFVSYALSGYVMELSALIKRKRAS